MFSKTLNLAFLSFSIDLPSLNHSNVTFGAPLAWHMSFPVPPLSLADFDSSGESLMIGLSGNKKLFYLEGLRELGKYFNLRLTRRKSFSFISTGVSLGTPLLAKHMNIPASLMVAFCMDKTDPFTVVSTVALEPE